MLSLEEKLQPLRVAGRHGQREQLSFPFLAIYLETAAATAAAARGRDGDRRLLAQRARTIFGLGPIQSWAWPMWVEYDSRRFV